MSSCQNDTGIITHSVDNDQKKEHTSKVRSDPVIGSSFKELTTSSPSTPEETVSENESEESKEYSYQKPDTSVQMVIKEHELLTEQKELKEFKGDTLRPITAKETLVTSPPVQSNEQEKSEETIELKSNDEKEGTFETEMDAANYEASTIEEKGTSQEVKMRSTPKESHASLKAAPIAENQEKPAISIDVDQVSLSEIESQSSNDLGYTLLPTKVDLKSLILDCYSMLTKEEEALLAKKLPSVDCHNGSIRPGFFDESNKNFWEAVNHWCIETDVFSSRYDTIQGIINKYSTGIPKETKRKITPSASGKKIARIRVNPPKPESNVNTSSTRVKKSDNIVKRTDLRSQSKKAAK